MIKNIIFDLGGILIDIFPEKAINKFKTFDYKTDVDIDKYFSKNRFFKDIEKLQNCEKIFIDTANSLLQTSQKNSEIIDAWNKLLGEWKPNSVKIAEIAKQKYRTFLLSNTNSIHYDFYIPKFKQEFGYNFHSLFEKTYFSHQIGMRKPDKKIFAHILSDANLIPEDTLFIDDSKENCIASEMPGIKTIEIFTNQGLEKNEKIMQYFH